MVQRIMLIVMTMIPPVGRMQAEQQSCTPFVEVVQEI